MAITFELRDPVHGFIHINEWEKEIINHPAFQRLRRIRQLGWANMVYPGAMHTRFEHSLGVMHIATQMYDEIVNKNKEYLNKELHYDDAGLLKDRVIVRLASLLHDIGHAPFSHAGEDLMPINKDNNKQYNHEEYSAAIIEFLLKDVIEDHNLNYNYDIKAKEIADFLLGKTFKRSKLWKGIVSSQLDADRADYLLRDSLHSGVAYGNYDLHRLLNTITIAEEIEETGPNVVIAVEKGGWHVAESLIIARYMMFSQVYFQHTVSVFGCHICETLKNLLKEETGSPAFPPPDSKENIEKYLDWNDWKVQGLINLGKGGQHGKCIKDRKHYKRIHETKETPDIKDLENFEKIIAKIKNEVSGDCFLENEASKSYYKLEDEEINIYRDCKDKNEKSVKPLSEYSSIVKNIKPIKQKRIFVNEKEKDKIEKIINQEVGGL